jgi:hypothetical protein
LFTARGPEVRSALVNGVEAEMAEGGPLFNIAKNLPDGGVSAPIETPNGIHVLYMLASRIRFGKSTVLPSMW